MLVIKNAVSCAIERVNIKVQVSHLLQDLPQNINIKECCTREYVLFNTVVSGSHLKNQELFQYIKCNLIVY